MAQRKKRATLGKRKSTARSQSGKTRTRGKPAKRTVAKSKPRKRLAKVGPKRAAAKKAASKMRQVKRPSSPTVETITIDVIEEPVPGVIAITEFEETEVRDEDEGREQPDETPRGSEEQ